MNCLSPQQIQEYLSGNTSEDMDLHLAQCDQCRTLLVQVFAEKNKSPKPSPDLIDKTIKSLKKLDVTNITEPGCVVKGKRLVFSIRVYATAALIFLSITALVYLGAKAVRHPVPSAQTTLPNVKNIEKSQQADTGSVHSAVHAWLDTAGIKDRKQVGKNIRIEKKAENFMQFGAKTCVVLEGPTKINVARCVQDTILLDMRSGLALFTVESKRYKSFCVLTPHVRICVTGTIFSVFVDSLKTTVQVIEGSVQLHHEEKIQCDKAVQQGQEATTVGDSIDAEILMNALTANKRGRMLRDYIQSTILNDDIHTIHDVDSVQVKNINSSKR